MTTKNKKIVSKSIFKTVDTVKNTATMVNAFALKSTEKVVSEAITTAEQWQGVTAKAVKGGLKVAATQQDIMFDTLETAKGQILKGFNRTKVLFSKN